MEKTTTATVDARHGVSLVGFDGKVITAWAPLQMFGKGTKLYLGERLFVWAGRTDDMGFPVYQEMRREP